MSDFKFPIGKVYTITGHLSLIDQDGNILSRSWA
jgi:hypothetical protein